VLEATGETYEYVSLADLQVGGCRGCTRCAADNRCKVKDDWPTVGEKMLTAEAIVFGAPCYYGTINALGHACLERTFCFRHREVFCLAGKLGIAIGVDGGEENSPVLAFIRRMMASNLMVVVDTVYVDGYSQCYTCGFGEGCAAGGVVKRHGFLESIDSELYPPRFDGQETAKYQAYKAGKTLGSIIRARREQIP
jgi:multimeric flavodoxin WrbA